jgi:hypothetical protein
MVFGTISVKHYNCIHAQFIVYYVAHFIYWIAHKYANIIGISPLPKGLVCPPAFNTALCYNTEEHDEAVFSQLPEFIQDKIKMSDEWIARISKPAPVVSAPASVEAEFEDDGFPF